MSQIDLNRADSWFFDQGIDKASSLNQVAADFGEEVVEYLNFVREFDSWFMFFIKARIKFLTTIVHQSL